MNKKQLLIGIIVGGIFLVITASLLVGSLLILDCRSPWHVGLCSSDLNQKTGITPTQTVSVTPTPSVSSLPLQTYTVTLLVAENTITYQFQAPQGLEISYTGTNDHPGEYAGHITNSTGFQFSINEGPAVAFPRAITSYQALLAPKIPQLARIPSFKGKGVEYSDAVTLTGQCFGEINAPCAPSAVTNYTKLPPGNILVLTCTLSTADYTLCDTIAGTMERK